MSDNVFGKNETQKLRQEIVAAIVQRSLAESGQLIPTVTDVSQFAQAGVSAINFPRRVGTFTVQNLIEDSAADVQSYEYDLDKLELNHHAIISFFIKKRASMQANIDVESDAIIEAAREHAIDIDRNIIEAMKNGASSANDVSVTGSWTKTKLLEVKTKLQKSTRLRSNQVPFYLLVNSDREAQLLDIPNFVEADKYGSNLPVLNGELGRIYGFRVLVTDEPVLGANTALAWIPTGIVFGAQMQPELKELYIPKRAGTEYALDQLYGIKVLSAGAYISKITFN